jgi:hypothetical protein
MDVIEHADTTWEAALFEDRLALQDAFFPEGVTWTPAGFGTGANTTVFSYLNTISSAESVLPER